MLPDVDEREREMREWCHVLNRGIEPLVGNDATKFAAFVVNDNGRKVNVLIPRIKTPVPLVFFTGTVVMDKVAEAKYASWDEVRQGELQTQLAYEMAHFELGTQASYRKGEFSFTIANEALASDVQDVDSFARHVQKVTRGIVICLIVIHRSLGVGPTPVGVHASPIVGEESDTPVPLS